MINAVFPIAIHSCNCERRRRSAERENRNRENFSINIYVLHSLFYRGVGQQYQQISVDAN